jgi:hypothetical protein
VTKPKATNYAHLESLPESWWAYVAGLLVGEGHFGVSDGYRTHLEVHMCDFAVCRNLRRELGGSIRKGTKGTTRRYFQESYYWVLTDHAAISYILPRITKYMLGNKGKQAVEFAKLHEFRLGCYFQRVIEGRARYSAAERLQMLRLAKVVRGFNGGGNKQWKLRWRQRERELAKEVRDATMQTMETVRRPAAPKVQRRRGLRDLQRPIHGADSSRAAA